MKRFLLPGLAALLLNLSFRPAAAQTGEFRISAGLAQGHGSGKLVTAASFAFVKSKFSFGPEAIYAFGDERIFAIGGISRLLLGSSRLKPYLAGGLGGYYWKPQNHVTAGLFSGSLGAGIFLTQRRELGITLEARVHKNLQNYDGGGNWDFVTITAGGRIGW